MANSVALVATEFVIVSLSCFFLVRYYKSNLVTFDVALTVYFSWILGFAGVLLLPYDLSMALTYGKRSAVLVDVWEFIYWR